MFKINVEQFISSTNIRILKSKHIILFFTLCFLLFTVVKAVEAIKPIVMGRNISSIFNKFGEFWTEVVQDGQLRWVCQVFCLTWTIFSLAWYKVY